MARNARYRGMSLGTRMLLFSSVFLLALPWLGYRYMDEMKDFLLKGQEDAQALAARAIASVLNGRAEMFYPVDDPAALAIDESALFVYPLEEPKQVDGYPGDWGVLLQQAKRFAGESTIFDKTGDAGDKASFELLLGEYGQYIYVLLRVSDLSVVYRNPQYRRLDHSDHVRLELMAQDGKKYRYILLTEGQGRVSVYEMNADWVTPATGKPVYAITGVWREKKDGYDLEIKIPTARMSPQPRLMISVADVNSPVERGIESIIATLVQENHDTLNRLLVRSAELDQILRSLGASDAGICVVDRYRRIRGLYGGEGNGSDICSQKDTVAPVLVSDALRGKQSVVRHYNSENESLIIAAHPVYANDDLIGAVLVEKNSSEILALQQESLLKVLYATFLVFLAALITMLMFSAWLAYRLRRLQRETASAIDKDGRIVSEHIVAEQSSADELGQLSRDITGLLSRLRRYTGFLESMPRTLRHEILNPVNTISMSLQKMESGNIDQSLIQSARRASQQLEVIVQGLTEAAHIEDAVTQDEYHRFDLAELVTEYVNNSRLKHGKDRIQYSGPASQVFVVGSDLRIAQLLDKLKDNALDFSDASTEVVFELKVQDQVVLLSVSNHGPAVSQDVLDNLFISMISSRDPKGEKPHLGIGLYIANRIAQQHGGSLKMTNLDNNQGVKVSLLLPIAS